MKPIKMFSLGALTALMTMAFAGSAMAESTTLCTQDPGTGAKEKCQSGSYTHVHALTLVASPAILLSSALNLKCDVLFLGDVEVELASPLVIQGTFSYSNCSNSCTLTEENGPAKSTLLKEGYETASITIEWLIHLTCSGINCIYKGTGLSGKATGGLLAEAVSGEVIFSEQILNKESGLFCPNTAKLDASAYPLERIFIDN